MDPEFELIIECTDVTKGLPYRTWDDLSPELKRAAGLTARWAIENAFQAAILQKDGQRAQTRDLIDLCTQSAIQLNPSRKISLVSVNQYVKAQEPIEGIDEDAYLLACETAIGIVGTVQQDLLLRRG